MWFLDKLVESRVREARERGAFDDLPGAGKPLPARDDALVPPELRSGYRLLKNAGYLPEELRLRREIHDAEALLRQATTAEERRAAGHRLQLLLDRLGRERATSLRCHEAYYQRLVARLGRSDR